MVGDWPSVFCFDWFVWCFCLLGLITLGVLVAWWLFTVDCFALVVLSLDLVWMVVWRLLPLLFRCFDVYGCICFIRCLFGWLLLVVSLFCCFV